jgi:hypothetical protein
MQLKQVRLPAVLALGALISLVLMGCSKNKKFTPEDFKEVKKGMTEGEVEELLGPPKETMVVLGAKRSFWQVGERYYSISFADGKVVDPLGPTDKKANDALKALIKTIEQIGKGGGTGPELPLKGPKEPATTKDGRWILSLSTEGFTVKGTPVQIGQTKKPNLEKLLGPPDRLVKLDPGATQLAFWDKKGIRAYVSLPTQKVMYFDCFL